MLRLDLNPEPRWIDLLAGVRLHVAPLSSAIWLAAKAEVEATGATDPAAAAEWSVDILKAVARRVILDWSGIGDLDGAPIPPSPAAISALLDRNDAWEAFNEQVFAPWFLLSAEKNASAPSPDSTSARATTAVDAPAPVRTVPGGFTPRRPTQAG